MMNPSLRQRQLFHVLIVGFIVAISVLDYFARADIILSQLYILVMPVVLVLRSRSWLWGVTAATVLLTVTDALVGMPAGPHGAIWVMWTNRSLAILAMLVLAAVFDRYLLNQTARARAEARVREEVAAREAVQVRLVHAQRMEALGRLAGGIAHDFNNVLQAVHSTAAMIERAPAQAERVRHLAGMLIKAANRGTSITRRLLAFSRRGELRIETVAPAPLLADIGEILTHTLGNGIRLRVDAPASLPPLLADRSQLETVLINLATNARDAMEDGGLLTLAAAFETVDDEEAVHVADLKAGSYIRLSVTDTGVGILPELLEHVTEPFFTTKPKGKGTGLGLAMAHGFATQSGGALHIESTPGHGTAVTLWFPTAERMAPAAERTASTRFDRTSCGDAPCLLIVDDDQIVRELLVEQFRMKGYTVLSAADGASALDLLDTAETVDLVISDLTMPGMDGLALIEEIRRRRKNTPAILLSGYAENAERIAVGGAASGSFSMLRKPVQERQLHERVSDLLRDGR